MNPLTSGDGSSKCVVENGHVVDDGNFFTQNKPTLNLRAYRVTTATGAYVAGVPEPRPVGWRHKKDDKPYWILTRFDLSKLDLTTLGPGNYMIRVWGVNDDDSEYYEIGSEDSAHPGVDVSIVTTFRVGVTPPPSDPKKELIEVLLATQQVNKASLAYRLGWKAPKTVDRNLTDAIDRARRL